MPNPPLVACTYQGSLFKIDQATGAGALIGGIGFIGTNSLACDSSGKLYSVAVGPLITIDPQTGAGTFVKQLQPLTDIRDLAFSPKNILFGIRDGGAPPSPPGGPELPDDLVTINVGTGAVTLVGNTGRSGLQGIAFSPNGILYGWDIVFGLVTIDSTTGLATLVDPAPPGGHDYIQGLSFGAGDTLFGVGNPDGVARGSLYTIDLTTGKTTLIGTGSYFDSRGIAFLYKPLRPPPFPRWAWLWLILVGYILVTPIGPLCIACTTTLSGLWIRLLGISVILLSAIGLWGELKRLQNRR